jgi:hypothetical protein
MMLTEYHYRYYNLWQSIKGLFGRNKTSEYGIEYSEGSSVITLFDTFSGKDVYEAIERFREYQPHGKIICVYKRIDVRVPESAGSP